MSLVQASRDAAEELLREAQLGGDVEQLTTALRHAALAKLEGRGEEDGIVPEGRWMVASVRQAYIALARLQQDAAANEAAQALTLAASRVSVRSETLGVDRYGRRYWHLELPPPRESQPIESGGRALRGRNRRNRRNRRCGGGGGEGGGEGGGRGGVGAPMPLGGGAYWPRGRRAGGRRAGGRWAGG